MLWLSFGSRLPYALNSPHEHFPVCNRLIYNLSSVKASAWMLS
uniref:Uncharacterized protein n=1 Tax=Arundo donax TaxID=35708 RepID=A0A0A8Y651_ARUDO